ncbi:MAG: hypothetical protein ACI9DF_004995, partial [Verrucomicrobiales bacterium]
GLSPDATTADQGFGLTIQNGVPEVFLSVLAVTLLV